MVSVCVCHCYSNNPIHVTDSFQNWIRISEPVGSSVQWPVKRRDHAAACVSDSVLVMIGGYSGGTTLNDCWICDTTTRHWQKVQ